jgi:hypothetical protein
MAFLLFLGISGFIFFLCYIPNYMFKGYIYYVINPSGLVGLLLS